MAIVLIHFGKLIWVAMSHLQEKSPKPKDLKYLP